LEEALKRSKENKDNTWGSMTLRKLFKEIIIRSYDTFNDLLDFNLKNLFSLKIIIRLLSLCFLLWISYHLIS
jgi:hypothetical protein